MVMLVYSPHAAVAIGVVHDNVLKSQGKAIPKPFRHLSTTVTWAIRVKKLLLCDPHKHSELDFSWSSCAARYTKNMAKPKHRIK